MMLSPRHALSFCIIIILSLLFYSPLWMLRVEFVDNTCGQAGGGLFGFSGATINIGRYVLSVMN
jgi:hypothetical protein